MKIYNHRAKASLLLIAVLFMAPVCRLAAGQEAEFKFESRDETIRRYGLVIESTLESRIQDVLSPEVLKRFDRSPVLPTIHVLTADERQKVAEAFAALPPVHRRILIEHLRGITFLDGTSTSGRDQIRFYTSDPMVEISQAVSTYQALQKTPFVSLYGDSIRGTICQNPSQFIIGQL